MVSYGFPEEPTSDDTYALAPAEIRPNPTLFTQRPNATRSIWTGPASFKRRIIKHHPHVVLRLKVLLLHHRNYPEKVEEELKLRDLNAKMLVLQDILEYYNGKKHVSCLKTICQNRNLQGMMKNFYLCEINKVKNKKYYHIPLSNIKEYVKHFEEEIIKLDELMSP